MNKDLQKWVGALVAFGVIVGTEYFYRVPWFDYSLEFIPNI